MEQRCEIKGRAFVVVLWLLREETIKKGRGWG